VRCIHDQGVSYRRMEQGLGISRSTLCSMNRKRSSPQSKVQERQQDDVVLRLWLRELKSLKPSWGIRRVRAWVRKALELPIGRKKLARILREEGLRGERIKRRQSRQLMPRPAIVKPNQVWAMDMTCFMLSGGQKLFLVVVLDIFSRRIVGWHLSFRCRAGEWLKALDSALQAEFPAGVRGSGLRLRMDNGCQPTSRLFQETLQTLEITPEWTGYNSPKQNAHVERVIGTLKADWIWLEEHSIFIEAQELVARAVTEYNKEHPHSNLGFLSPEEFKRAYEEGRVRIGDQNKWEITQKAA
jgi:putative transposase